MCPFTRLLFTKETGISSSAGLRFTECTFTYIIGSPVVQMFSQRFCGVSRLFINSPLISWMKSCVEAECCPATPRPDIQHDAKCDLRQHLNTVVHITHVPSDQDGDRFIKERTAVLMVAVGIWTEGERTEQFQSQPNQTSIPAAPSPPQLIPWSSLSCLFAKWKQAPQALRPVSINLKRHNNQWQRRHSIYF